MTLTKDQLEKMYPGVKISGDPNPGIPDSQWHFSCGLASLIANQDRKKTQEATHLYCLQVEGMNIFKIGITSNIEDRLKSLQVGCHSKLKVLKCIKIANAKSAEKGILRDLSDYVTSGEWVECEKSVVLKVFKKWSSAKAKPC